MVCVLQSARRLLVCLMLLSVATPAAAQGFKWWQDEGFRRELGLTADQVTRLDEVFQAALPLLRTQKSALDSLEADFSRMVADARADEPAALDVIARVESARAELGRTRGLMLFRMRRILTADQHVKLKALHAARERTRHRAPAGKSPGAGGSGRQSHP